MSRVGRWVPVAAVIALLGAAMVASIYANPTIANLPQQAPRTGSLPESTQQHGPTQPAATPTPASPPEPVTSLPVWLGWVMSALGAAVVAVVALLIWLLLRHRLTQRRTPLSRERPGLPTIAETSRRVRVAVDEGLADLVVADADPRRAVIACWVRLERAAAEAGTPREVGDTSTDLVSRLLATHMISGNVLAAFASVYREARFATHTVDVAMREQARAALRQMRDELTAGVAVSP
jgi:hypothetical protein